MTQQHPIIPPPELFAEWLADAKRLHPGESTGFIAGEIARLAYQAGADQELEACCEWLDDYLLAPKSSHLRAARRPKPPSLKEQALLAIDTAVADYRIAADVADVVRLALEQLPDNN
jgi:hypothetical protein